jgi:hypothetical protein
MTFMSCEQKCRFKNNIVAEVAAQIMYKHNEELKFI